MHDIPPPEAFERQPEPATGRSSLRRRIQVVVTLAVVASLVVLAAVEGGGFITRGDDNRPPTAVLAAGRLAVVDAAGSLSTVDGQGGSAVSYAVPGVTFAFPAWSPDGSRLAAIGAASDGSGVYVFAARAADAAGNEPSVVYRSADRPPFYLYWTPDGRQVTFLTTEPDGLALRIVPVDGSGAPSVVRSGAPMYWDFVDPGRLLVHSGTSGPEGFFGEVALDGAPFEGTDRSVGVFRAPAVSADAGFRAYLGAGEGAVGEVVREARDGSGTTRIRVFGPAAMAFGPTGDGLAFLAPDQLTSPELPLPVGPLRLLDAGAAAPRTLLGGNVVAFFWSPTGEVIAALQLDDGDDTVTAAVARPALTAAVARPALTAAAPRPAAAGLPLRLSVVSVADGTVRFERHVRVSDLFVNQVLPFFDQYARSHRFWAPDGTALVLPLVGDDDVTQLVAIPADGSDARVVARAEMGFWAP